MKSMLRLMLYVLTLTLIWGGNVSAVDHSFIEGTFTSGPEVTKTCLECHEGAATEVMATSHWAWESEQIIDGKKVLRGKKNVMNNFCGSIPGSEPRCTSCHVGYGWKDDSFDFADQSRVDCLVCHDSTGTYKKTPTGAGNPAGFTGNAKSDKNPVDLTYVAQNVALPGRANCIVCHGLGGGGNNVKHGDIETALIEPTMAVDFHMGTDSLNFSCQDCHTTSEHDISGTSLLVSPNNDSEVTCLQCHDAEPHGESILNKHTAAVSCQACHIPVFAKVNATKMSWDWSQSKKTPKDKKVIKDQQGNKIFVAKKGSFTFATNVIPEYRWYNGLSGYYSFGDTIDPSKTTSLNYPIGDIADTNAKIMPFKVHTGKQIYDSTYNYFITPKLFGFKGDKEAYWKNYATDPENAWHNAAAAGMKASGLAYSGSYGFAATETYWPINHMVAEANMAVGCLECHGDSGRLDWAALGYQGDPMTDSKFSR